MKVFAATADSQGERRRDFCWTVEGEPVMPTFECDRDRDDREGVDGGCGCRRAMAGMTTRSATTMFRVVDVEVTLGQFRDWLFGLLEESGWNLGREDAALLAEDVAEAADAFDVGTVLERRSDDIQTR